MKPWLLALLVCSVPVCAQQQAIRLDPARTAVIFTLGDVLHTVHGTFKLKRGALRFDPATGQASGEIAIDAASGDSGNAMRDGRMHREILESARFPEAVFTPDRISGAIAPQGESQVEFHGAFLLHGSSHEMTLAFRVQANAGELTGVTHFIIPYVKWGLRNPSNFLLRVSDKVEMTVEAVGRLEPDGPPAQRAE